MFDAQQSGVLCNAAPVASATRAVTKDTWDDVKKVFRKKVGEDIFNSWFARMDFEGKDLDAVRLSVPTRFLKSWITSHYSERLLECWHAEVSSVSRLEITVRSAALRSTTARPEPALPVSISKITRDVALATHDVRGGAPLDPRYTFEHFVIGRSNALVNGAARQVAAAKRTDSTLFNPLYIHGGVGLGKTHVLQAIAWTVNTLGERRALYLTAEKFMHGFVQSLRAQNVPAFKESVRGTDVFLVDDLQFLQGRASQSEFAFVLKSLVDAGRQVVLSCDRPPSEMEHFDEYARSRLAGGLVAEVGKLDESLRLEILTKRAALHRTANSAFDVPQDILAYLAKLDSFNGRDIEGALNRLLAHHKLTGHPLTMEMVEHEVRDLIRTNEPRRVRIEDIQRVVARRYNIARTDLLSSRRTANIVRPRQVAMYLAKNLTLRSLPEIGRRFGGRDHTTVLHSVRKIERLLGDDMELAGEIQLLKGDLE